ncbi:CbxX/CfqX [Niveomyces insectorum RCEF 264]|uniref:CbxX/CfqX n=1 Tax=Niveomyces insectorum RCEF 264 TaxID=1081102 RepID=A0A167S1J4_9HYPO|nr:CbxX/CfqX [Niveomyces insectorum RCEF 264]
MASTGAPDRQTAKLYAVFKKTLNGTRNIDTSSAAKLFLTAVCSQDNPTTCVEALLASPAGLDALRSALRADLSDAFVHGHAVSFLRYVSAPAVKMLANGALLSQLLVAVAQPPTFWAALCAAVQRPDAPPASLAPFAWLALELLCLPAHYEVDVTTDVQSIMQANVLLRPDTTPFEARQTGYKIQNLLKRKTAGCTTTGSASSSAMLGPGGRHDNDFADFRQIAILPTADELLSTERPFYRVAADAFAPDVAVADRAGIHLDNLFRLTRESMLTELREDVQVAMGAKKPRRRPFVLGELTPCGIYTGGDDNDDNDDEGSGNIQTPRALWLSPLPFKKKRRRTGAKCALVLACQRGLLESLRNASPHQRKAYLKDHPSYLKHQALGVLLRGKIILGFAVVDRNEDLLADSYPPRVCLQFADRPALARALLALKTAPEDVQFVLVGTPVFAFEPVLKRMQTMVDLPLERELMDTAAATATAAGSPAEGGASPPNDFVAEPRVQEFVAELQRRAALAGAVDDANVTVAVPQISGEPVAATAAAAARKNVRLDRSQTASLVAALTGRLTLIQGPPGTGKSFLGALFVKILFYLTDQKILLTTYTNHALDQCLSDLLDMGIDAGQMVRLGSKATDKTSGLLLSKQQSTYKRRATEFALIDGCELRLSTLKHEITQCYRTQYAHGRVTFDALQDYLQFSDDHGDFAEAFALPDDAAADVTRSGGFTTVGGGTRRPLRPDYLFQQWRRGRNAGLFHKQVLAAAQRSPAAMDRYNAVWGLDRDARGRLLRTWEEAVLREHVDWLARLVERYDREATVVAGLWDAGKKHILQARRIVACTTTAAAMYADLLAAVQPDVVLVEEAGEILECQVLTALAAPSVQQLVLIGDHKQLRPKVDAYALTVEHGGGYDLNRSLFERLVVQGHAHTTLQKQHRMCPAISVFSREDTYPEMLDAPGSTDNRPAPRGVRDRVVFLNHGHPEDHDACLVDRRDPDCKASKSNAFEAAMVLRCVRYLCQQGYGTQNMVVLTPYLGQVRLLTQRLREDEDDLDAVLSDLDAVQLLQAGLLPNSNSNSNSNRNINSKHGGASAADPTNAAAARRALRISTIDNYQGEESDIVLVSLTRCNDAGDIGFLAAPQRVNVLRTRARNCLVLVGNAATFLASRKGAATWAPFLGSLADKGHLYNGLPVRCEQHPEVTALLAEPDDFGKYCPDGGCSLLCDALLPCKQHTCRRRCHRGPDHTQVICSEVVHVVCDRGHKRRVACSKRNEVCARCQEEDRETLRRARRDLALEQARRARQQAYRQELQLLDDEIDHQRRIVKDQRDADDEKAQLAYRRDELAAIQRTAKMVQVQKMAAEQKRKADDKAATNKADQKENQPGESNNPWPEGKASEEWADLKRETGVQNAAIDEIMAMVGLEDVKQEFLSIKTRVDIALRQGVSLAKERFGCVLVGNPGTGKTTVARLLMKLLTGVGVIPGTCYRETTGAALANGGVTGCQTLVDEVLNDGGGVVFIDEAYQLASGTNYGGGAVLDYLLPEVENLRGKIVFVLAGYSREMEAFFAHNPGLPSRFPVELTFADYTDEELRQIFTHNIVQKYGAASGAASGGGDGAREGGMKVEGGLDGLRTGCGGRGKKLQALTGLREVKDAVRTLVDTIQQNYVRELAEQPPVQYSLNKLFLGAPGTGKTTVAKLYGEILVELGLLSKGEVVVKNPADFVGAALGQSEKQTKGILAATQGKVLVIDEAYGLYGGGGGGGGGGSTITDPYKTAVIDTIVAEVQSVPGDDRCVLLLGYHDQMETMLQNVNPGLSRRFPLASAFHFADFSDEELYIILAAKVAQQGFAVTDKASRVAMEMLQRARNRPNFGNAGEIDILLDAAKARQQHRLSKAGQLAAAADAAAVETKKKKGAVATPASVLEAVDFDPEFARADGDGNGNGDGPRGETDVHRLFAGTFGQEAVAARLAEFQETVRTLRALDLDPREQIPFAFVFRGPPGTGKTTTAQKMGKVFYDLGFLDRAEVEQCSATDLIGQYVGQTGPKVLAQLDRALGKVLFIDEAYRLSTSSSSSSSAFAKEATDELVDALTKPRYKNRLVVILAGYTDEMDGLLAANPGLTSRFSERIDFRPLRADECIQLLRARLGWQKVALQKKGVTLDLAVFDGGAKTTGTVGTAVGFHERMTTLFDALIQENDWASARDVETLARDVFNDAIRPANRQQNGPGGGSQGSKHIVVTDRLVEENLTKMLGERRRQSAAAKRPGRDATNGLFRSLFQQQPPPQQTRTDVQTATNIQTTTEPLEMKTEDNPPADENNDDQDKSGPAGGAAPPQTKAEIVMDNVAQDNTPPPPGTPQRDAGVSDAVWEQLQRDRRAAEARDAAYRQMKADLNNASEARREQIVTQLIEEEKRRAEEAARQARLQEMGRCPVGYAWIKQSQGWRCAGGSHYLDDAAVDAL